jgi:hypothetical protein
MTMMMIDDENNRNDDDDDDNNNNNKYIDKVGTFESHGHSSKRSIVHSAEYSIKEILRKKYERNFIVV